MTVEVFVDIFNVYNRQGTFDVDDDLRAAVRCAAAVGEQQNVNPIVGRHVRGPDLGQGDRQRRQRDARSPIGRNPNFGNTTARYAPASARVGLPADVLAERRARSRGAHDAAASRAADTRYGC